MAVEISHLPLKAQQQVLRKMQEANRKRERIATAPAEPRNDAGKGSKYGNRKDVRVVDGRKIVFDSMKEARRYDELMLWQQAGQIRDLRLQVGFTLKEPYTTADGLRIRAIRYDADFTYWERVPEMQEGKTNEVCSKSPQSAALTAPLTFKGSQGAADDWKFVVEDVKSNPTRTKTYMMKKKLMADMGYQIREV